MRKYFLSFVALAAGLFATSCQESIVEPQVAGPTTFTVQLPEGMGTKAIGDASSVTELLVDVYAQHGTAPIYQTKGTPNGNNGFDVQLNLIQDQSYDILFWAQTEDGYVDVSENDGKYLFGSLRSVPMNANFLNNDNGAAFFHAEKGFVPNGTSKDIVLVRPFAQLNLGTTDASLITNAGNFQLVSSSIKVTGMANQFNVFEGLGFGETVATYDYGTNGVPQEGLSVSGVQEPFNYVSMNYLAVLGNEKALVDVEALIVVKNIATDETQTINHTFTNVPVQENYRTNIVGNLISSTTDFVVTIEEGFVDENGTQNPDNDYFVVDNVAEAHNALLAGETYIAINSIRNGESVLELDNTLNTVLYIQLPDTDATLTVQGTNVKELYLSVPDTNPDNDGLTLSINTPNAHVVLTGQVYDVPFSSTSSSTLVLDGVKITKSVTVEQGNVVVGEGTEIGGNDDGSQIISDEAIVIINGTENEIIVEGDDVVVVEGTQDEINVSNVFELRAAVNTIDAGGVINITKNIDGVGDVILIDKNITINGADKSISGNASRIFRICSSDLKVEMNDLNIVSTAVRIGTNDIRGISLDTDLKNVTLILNNCSVDFNDASAYDWSYGVNFTGGTTNTLIINGGVYEGANTINLRGDEHEISIEEAELTSIYGYNDKYFGHCIRLDCTGSVVNVKNTIFNGDHSVAIGGNSENEITVEGNTDNTKYAKVKAGDKYCYSLEEAIGSIESEGVIKLLSSIESDPVTIPNGKTITLNLNGKTITAVDNSTGSYGLITNNANLTIKGPGTISISATNNRGWNAYSSVISNQPGGNLTVGEGVVIKHLGGTDMAYGIDNLTNGKGTSAIVTINDATVKSPYRAVRQFLNGVEANNSLTVNSGAVIEGANKSIWMQDPSTKPNTGTLVVNEEATLNGDVYLYVCAGSTEWPVSVSIAASTVKGEVLTGNVPAGYEVVEVDGVWTVRRLVSNASELQAALTNGGLVVLGADIDLTNTLEIGVNKTVVLDLNGNTIIGKMHKSVGAVIKNNGTLTIKNGTISSTEANGGSAIQNSGTLTVEDATFNGAPNADGSWPSYTVNNTGELIINNSNITSYHGSVASYGDNAIVEMNNTNIDMTGIPGFTSHGIYTYNNGKVTVNGGIIANKATDQAASGASVINGSVTVNAGEFTGRIENYYGTPVLKGGTYSVKPNPNFIADGYKVVEVEEGKLWKVEAE